MAPLFSWKSWFASIGRRPRRRKSPQFFGSLIVAADVLETRLLLSSAAPQMSLTLQSGNLTLTSTDINNPNVTISRSGSFVVFAGANGTQITYTNNGSTGTTQSIPVASVGNLTINLGSGSDTISMSGLSVVGNVTVNGQQTGVANVAISAGTPNVTIGGSIVANFGGEAATFGVFGSANGGGNLTVNGSVNFTESGSGTQQVNLYGPPANNPLGGKLAIKGNVAIVDTGTGTSGLTIDDGVTIGGNVSFDNSTNNVNSDIIQIFSNSNAFGVTSIGGSLALELADSPYYGNTVEISGTGSQLPVTGPTTITSGGGGDNIQLLDVWFKNTVTVDADGNLAYVPDQVVVQGSRFDSATQVTETGPYAELGLGTLSSFAATVFNSTLSAQMTGPSAVAFLSNPTSTGNQVVFNSTAAFTGGSPVGSLVVQGHYFVGAGKQTLTNFKVQSPPAVTPKVSLTTQSNNVTLTSTDINNPDVTITRSGNFVVFTGVNGTQITYTNNGSTGTTQSIALPSMGNLTINLGTGFDIFTMSGVSLTGNVTVNGQATGGANVLISAATPSVTIGGSIHPAGGKLAIKGNVTVLDTGDGNSGLLIGNGVAIGGNVSYDNSANTVYGDNVQILSNSQAFGTTSIGGNLALSLSSAVYSGDSVVVSGTGTQLVVTGATNIDTGSGSDMIQLLTALFKKSVTVNSGISPSFSPDTIVVQGSQFSGPATMTLSGPYAQLGLGTVASYGTDVFNGAFSATLSGPNAAIYVSNPNSTSNAVIFNSTASMVGGTPAGTLFIQGLWFVGAGKLTRTNFNLV
jgi:hypothetical protein